MNIYFDTEFTGLHKDTTLISIGLISEDNKTFYAEFNDYDKSQCDDWIQKNVVNNLLYNTSDFGSIADVTVYSDKKGIATKLEKWLSQWDAVELVSDVSHYDMVLFCDIYGSAFDIPKNVCACCHDINQDIAWYFGSNEKDAFDKNRESIIIDEDPSLIPEGKKHNSLYDAKVIKTISELIEKTRIQYEKKYL